MAHSSKKPKSKPTSEQLVADAKRIGTAIDAVLLLETILLEEIEKAKQKK